MYFCWENTPPVGGQAENKYFLIFGRLDVFITHFSNRGYLQSIKAKEELITPSMFI
jgi:hypothetical protein